ncbi:hypothetical protein ACFYWO_01005 [Streptomyces sp. NPDC002932]|uniref:hypothetical protein n=1 Tax=Streptomyces sp. NPDC002932 TaxID=3364672 RepID=UPI0036A20BEB
MPRIGWSLGQKRQTYRYFWAFGIISVIGIIFSLFAVAAGKTGGWVLLGMFLCGDVALFLLVKNVKKDQPG